MDPVDVGWLAGLYEGEGTLVKTSSGSASLVIGMTDEDVIRRCLEVTGMGSVNGPHQYGSERKPRWVWSVSRREWLQELLPLLHPHLGQRRRARIDEVMERLSLGDRRLKPYTCGEMSGYRRHHRLKEQPCDPCKAARRDHQKRVVA